MGGEAGVLTCEPAGVPEDMGTEYLSECRLRMAPTPGTLAGLSTEGTWDRGVTGAVGVVGV